MRQFYHIILFLLFTVLSCAQKSNFIVQKEDKYEVVDGKKQIVGQTVRQLRPSDSLPITILRRVFNYEDDTRLRVLTGFSKKDGIQDYLLDSIFYDRVGNDTMTISFVRSNNSWQPTQTFYKKYNGDRKIVSFMTERLFNKDHYFKREIFYKYNSKGDPINEIEFECRQKDICDSTIKKTYRYSDEGKLDSTIIYRWENKNWTEIKKRKGR